MTYLSILILLYFQPTQIEKGEEEEESETKDDEQLPPKDSDELPRKRQSPAISEDEHPTSRPIRKRSAPNRFGDYI